MTKNKNLTNFNADRLTLKERLILRILLFIVNWLSRSCDDIHNFEIDKIMEEFELKVK